VAAAPPVSRWRKSSLASPGVNIHHGDAETRRRREWRKSSLTPPQFTAWRKSSLGPPNSPAVDWSQLNQLTDEQLVFVLLEGVHDALVVLWGRYHRLVLYVAVKIVPDHGEAEEVARWRKSSLTPP